VTMIVSGISALLTQVLEEVWVSADGLEAKVGDRELEAPSTDALRHVLSGALYDRLHAGRPETTGDFPRTFRDAAFERLLAAATPHQTTTVVASLVEPGDADSLVARMDGVKVRVAVSNREESLGESHLRLRIPAARPALSPGFFLVDGSAGSAKGRPVLRVYVHITEPGAAPGVWHAALSRLEAIGVPYRAKVSSNPQLFPRRDALVVYLDERGWAVADQLVPAVEGLAGVGEITSPFVHRLAPGVGLAWDPQDQRPGMSRRSFGEHRALALAEGLIAHALTRDGGPREAALVTALTAAGIDPIQPGRDSISPRLPGLGL
jgi:hypothetical protein